MANGMAGITTALVLAVALGGCGGSIESRAAAACADAAKERAEGKLLAVDIDALAKNATAEGKDELRLQAPITFDTGLQSQYSQTLDCRVRITDGAPQVVGVTFVF